MSWQRTCQLRFRRIIDGLSAALRDRHVAHPTEIGNGQHDCALSSLYWAVPSLPESEITQTFHITAETWPYGGVSNKEFAIALNYLKLESDYSGEAITLGALLAAKPARCVALVHGHFIPIFNGVIVGRDARNDWPSSTHVYCHWTFRQRAFRPV